MFLRKLFKAENKFTWVLVDLLIVIIGVYCAFLIQSYAEQEKNEKEKDRVITALKYELEAFRFQMTEFSLGMISYAQELSSTLKEGDYANFSDFRFIEPQYDYQTIQYSLSLQNPEIVDFELYNTLQSLFVEIKKMEHVERLITETSRRYHTLPSNLSKQSPEYKLAWADNYDNFNRFVTLINDRGNIAKRIAIASENALPLINDRLGEKKAKAVEKDLITQNLDKVKSEDEAVFLAKKLFPDFSEEEIRQLYRKANEESSSK
ncbi:hypothetical protein [Ekhidna sp.]|uniref:hypothetical protein n=1 Tax=Ekhidna sp. TaxID=2608089 RepID=UPI0035146E5B